MESGAGIVVVRVLGGIEAIVVVVVPVARCDRPVREIARVEGGIFLRAWPALRREIVQLLDERARHGPHGDTEQRCYQQQGQ